MNIGSGESVITLLAGAYYHTIAKGNLLMEKVNLFFTPDVSLVIKTANITYDMMKENKIDLSYGKSILVGCYKMLLFIRNRIEDTVTICSNEDAKSAIALIDGSKISVRKMCVEYECFHFVTEYRDSFYKA